jgi:DNA-binding transcriptional MocR family regulator
VFEQTLREGVYVAPGLMFSNSPRCDGFIRINCGTPRSPQVEHALATLAAVVHRLAA